MDKLYFPPRMKAAALAVQSGEMLTAETGATLMMWAAMAHMMPIPLPSPPTEPLHHVMIEVAAELVVLGAAELGQAYLWPNATGQFLAQTLVDQNLIPENFLRSARAMTTQPNSAT